MTTETDSQRSSLRVRATEQSPAVHTLEVEVDAARVRLAADRAYRDLAKRVQVRGFRPGRAPRSVLEKLYGASVAEQIQQTLVAETLSEAIEQAGLEPVVQPVVDAEPPAPDAGFRYTVRIEVKPVVSLPDTRGLPATRPSVEVAEAEVDRELETLRRRTAPVIEEPEGTAVRADHLLVVDFVGRVDGRPFKGGRGRGAELEMSSGRFLPGLGLLPGFADQLLGAVAGEDREVRVQFPEDYSNREVAGREAVFAVHVAEVKRREIPAVDDEFAKDLGDFDSLEALRERIRADLTAGRERAAKAEFHRSLIDSLIERAPFEVPPGLIERQLERQIDSARQQLEGSVPEETLAGQIKRWREEWRGRAERAVREMVLLEAVAQAEGILAEEAEVDARLERLALEQGMDSARLRKLYAKEGLLDALRAQLVDEKTLDFLAATAKIEEKTGT